MSNGCDDCKWAEWKRTSNGRLHPDKSGRCKFVWIPPPIPRAFNFAYGGETPKLSGGGYIERGNRQYDDCQCHETLSNAAIIGRAVIAADRFT
jgi:hypothetical protein